MSDSTQSAQGSTVKATLTQFFAAIPVPIVVTSAGAGAFAVGRLGATTPAFQVDASTGSQVAGLKVTGAATAGTVAVVVTDSGADANVSFNAKGTGTIVFGSVSTGRVTITPVTTVTGLATFTNGVVTSNQVSNLSSGSVQHTWSASYKALELGASNALMWKDSPAETYWFQNAYYDGSYKYATTAASVMATMFLGGFVVETAASGTAGNAITYTPRLDISHSGGVVISHTTTPGTDNTYTLGDVSHQWSDFRTVLATITGVATMTAGARVTGVASTAISRADAQIEIAANSPIFALYQHRAAGLTTDECAITFAGNDTGATLAKMGSISTKYYDVTASNARSVLRLNATSWTGGVATDSVQVRIFALTGVDVFGSSDTTGPGAAIMRVTGSVYGTVNLRTTSVTTNLTAGDIGMPNAKYLRGTVAAANANNAMIGLNASDETEIVANSLQLSILAAATRTTIGANGGASALTALPVGYLDVKIGGSSYQIPYYSRGG